MPKCIKCMEYLHPDMCVVVDEELKICKCVFCYTEKPEVTIVDEDDKPDYKINKKEAIFNYKKYIQDLKDDEKIQKVVMAGQENPFKH